MGERPAAGTGGISDLAMAGMICYARGERRIANALSLHFVHGMSYRRVGREVGASHKAVRAWALGYAATLNDYCRLRGVGPAAIVGARL